MTTKLSPTLRTLGDSDLQLTPIGFGAWAIGGGNWEYAWGPQDDNESIAAIHRALDLGVNWIDTAAIYGLGHSEEVVARALKTTSHKPLVFTKCSMRWHPDRSIYRSLTAASLAEELEASLRRLGVETIDLYQIHWPDPDAELEEGWEALSRFREQGKIRWIGVSNFSVEQMKRVQKIAPIASLQPPYSMLRPAAETELLPLCPSQPHWRHQLLAHGLRPAHRQNDRRAHCSLPGRRLASQVGRVQRAAAQPQPEIGGTAARNRRRPPSKPRRVAVAWTLHNPAITAAIVGGRSAAQVEGLSPALEFRLSDEEYARIHAFLSTNKA